jgi:hypothetical protein
MAKKPQLFNREFQKEQSEKYKYKHIHTGEYCTFEAYVAEYIVLRRAERLNLGKPSYKFWTKGCPEHWLWIKQLNAARELSKKYSEEAVLSFIKSDDFKKFLLIGIQKGKGRGWQVNPAIIPLLEKHQKIIDQDKLKIEQSKQIEISDTQETRQVFKKKVSGINKLRGI